MADPNARLEDPFGLVGTTLEGQYRVDQVVGEGGFGVVYRGWHIGLEQPIAIKALKVLADDQAVQDALFAKFKDEAKLLYTLSQASLNIVRSMDFGATHSPNGLWAPYMILEWLAGESLAEDLANRRRRGLRGRSLDDALALLEPAAEGLGIAHQRRVAHRDVKPANFFLLQSEPHRGLANAPAITPPPRVKVLDFGIAKIVRDNELPGTRSPFASFTWLYAAPEQLDPRIGQTGLATDVYSFALLLTELLTDRVPVDGRDVVSLMKAATDVTVRPTPKQRGVQVPDGIEMVCRRALTVDPRARYADIGELWAALVAARRSSSIPAISVDAGSSGSLRAVPSSLAETVPPNPPRSTAASSKGVFIPTGPPLGSAPPGYAPSYPSPGPQPAYGPVHGTGPIAPYVPPPGMLPPQGGYPYAPTAPPRAMPGGLSSTSVAILVVGLVVCTMILGACGVIAAACH